jgi:hypothetical protein
MQGDLPWWFFFFRSRVEAMVAGCKDSNKTQALASIEK